MNIYDAIVITIFSVSILLVVVVESRDIQNKIDEIQPCISEQICEELLPYGFRGRQHFVCYNGEDQEYEDIEQIIIKQWRNQ